MGVKKLGYTEESVRSLIEDGISTMSSPVDVTKLGGEETLIFRKVYSEMVKERLSDKRKLDEITKFGFLCRIGD